MSRPDPLVTFVFSELPIIAKGGEVLEIRLLIGGVAMVSHIFPALQMSAVTGMSIEGHPVDEPTAPVWAPNLGDGVRRDRNAMRLAHADELAAMVRLAAGWRCKATHLRNIEMPCRECEAAAVKQYARVLDIVQERILSITPP